MFNLTLRKLLEWNGTRGEPFEVLKRQRKPDGATNQTTRRTLGSKTRGHQTVMQPQSMLYATRNAGEQQQAVLLQRVRDFALTCVASATRLKWACSTGQPPFLSSRIV